MFELKYKITDADIKTEDKRTTLLYFAIYASIGLVGLAVGIVAIVLKPSTALFVLGIIMTALAAILFIIATILVIPGKSSVRSVLGILDRDLKVKIYDRGIDVLYDVDDELIVAFDYPQLGSIKLRDKYIAVYINNYYVLIIKSDERDELERVYDFLCSKTGKSAKRKKEAVAVQPAAAEEQIDATAAKDQTNETSGDDAKE